MSHDLAAAERMVHDSEEVEGSLFLLLEPLDALS